MDKKAIACPQCGTEIDLSAAMTNSIRDDITEQLEQQHSKAWQDKLSRLEQQYQQQHQAQSQSQQVELKSLQTALQAQADKTKQAQSNELKLREQARKIEAREAELELEVARKIDAERLSITQALHQRLGAENELKLKEKEQQIQTLRDSLSDAKRKAEQGSQETQGEALEISLEEALRQLFPQDDLQTVSKGVRGADILQTVRNSAMQDCGKILWEIKSTKSWSAAWVQKLKDDLRAANAQIPVLLTTALPKTIKRFGQHEGVWVADIASYEGVVSILRQQLIELEFVREASRGQQGKTELVYEYLIGDGFRNKVEAIVEAFDAMEQQLIRERRAMEKQWREREQIIRRMTTNTVGMYGEIKGIVGTSLPEIKQLELDSED